MGGRKRGKKGGGRGGREGGRDKLEQMWEKTFIVDLGKVDIADAYLFSYLFTSLK